MKTHKLRLICVVSCHVAVLTAMSLVHSAFAAPIFFVNPGTSVDNVLPWQAAVGGNFAEEDFEGFTSGDLVSSLTIGGITVDISLPDLGGEAQVFAGGYPTGGGVPGTVFGNALLNGRDAPNSSDDEIVFNFSPPVRGFGFWVFDDFGTGDTQIQLTANGATSATLDGVVNGVDGFIGVVDETGISTVSIKDVSSQVFFELDHFQVAPVPEPSALILLSITCAACALRTWRSKN